MTNKEILHKIENIFRTSTSPEELFDTFRKALEYKVGGFDIYKILLANPFLSLDEVKMYTEKLLKVFPESAFDICMWVAQVFENCAEEYECLESSIYYYTKAIEKEPTNHFPYLKLLSLYNTEIKHPNNKKIIEIVDAGVPAVHLKSEIYFRLADLYKRLGDPQNESRYLALAEKAAKREDK